MKVKRLLCAALVLALVLVVGYQVVVRLMIGYKIEHSRFLNWCQTLSVSDLEFATFSDPWQQEMFPFPENYILSQDEEARLVGILNQMDTDNLSIEDTIFRTSPVFTVCVATKEGKFLFQRQSEAEDILYCTQPSEEYDDYSVGQYNKLIVTCPELVDFVLEAAAQSAASAA